MGIPVSFSTIVCACLCMTAAVEATTYYMSDSSRCSGFSSISVYRYDTEYVKAARTYGNAPKSCTMRFFNYESNSDYRFRVKLYSTFKSRYSSATVYVYDEYSSTGSSEGWFDKNSYYGKTIAADGDSSYLTIRLSNGDDMTDFQLKVDLERYNYFVVYSAWWFWIIWVVFFIVIGVIIFAIVRRNRLRRIQATTVMPGGAVATTTTYGAAYPTGVYAPPPPGTGFPVQQVPQPAYYQSPPTGAQGAPPPPYPAKDSPALPQPQ